ncbi:hypothetical protein IWQ48_003844 [Labrenzia sp. EL_13]|nr:hypothetical protein [Labrenzia sp. EL_13]
MPAFFVAYSGRNIEKVSAIMYFLTQELGAENFWFAPTKKLQSSTIRESLSEAIEKASAVLIFESASTYRTMSVRHQFSRRLGQSELMLLHEREEALRLNKRIVNIAIGSPDKIGLNADDFNTFDLSMALSSRASRAKIQDLSSYLENI